MCVCVRRYISLEVSHSGELVWEPGPKVNKAPRRFPNRHGQNEEFYGLPRDEQGEATWSQDGLASWWLALRMAKLAVYALALHSISTGEERPTHRGAAAGKGQLTIGEIDEGSVLCGFHF